MEYPQAECRAEMVEIFSVTPSQSQDRAALLGHIWVLGCIAARTYICQGMLFQPGFLGEGASPSH